MRICILFVKHLNGIMFNVNPYLMLLLIMDSIYEV